MNVNKYMKIQFLFLAILMLAMPAFASHDNSATLMPEWSPANQNVDYTVTICNEPDGGDPIDEVRIYKNENYDNFVADPKTGWYLGAYNPVKKYYQYTAETSGDYIYENYCNDFTFSATTPPASEEHCDLEWKFETRDITNVWKFAYDTTSVDNLPPVIVKTLGEPIWEFGGETWITQNTEVTIDAYDEGDCGISGLDYCEYRYAVDGIWGDTTKLYPNDLPYTFQYPQDSMHELEIRCYDVAGNDAFHKQWEYVETVPPITTKEFIGPFKKEGNVEWMDGITQIKLTPVDPDPHPSGIDKTWYRVKLWENDNYCWQPETCPGTGHTDEEVQEFVTCGIRYQDYCTDNWQQEQFPSWEACVEDYVHEYCSVPSDWHIYTEPIGGLEESCHSIHFFSIDNLQNWENPNNPENRNCFFVDKTPPVVSLETGEPKIACDPYDPSGCSYWVQDHVTPIDITCEDQGDHPSEGETIHYRIWDDISNAWTQWTEDGDHVQIIFEEDSVHKIQYWCEDAVEKYDGSEEKPYEITYRVDSVGPEIVKDVLGPQDGICPPGEGDDCYITDESTITVTVTDPDSTEKGCNVGVSSCYWWYEWEGENYQGSQFTDYTEIQFDKDSEHILHIECEDRLGNYTEDVETFLVDITSPETEKTYGTPYVSDGYPTYPEWITSQTPVFLDATDEKVGVDKIYWRNMVISNPERWYVCNDPTYYCNKDTYMQWVDNPQMQFTEVDGDHTEFYKEEESCHVIEFYSVDILGNKETLNYQCPFVDNKRPEVLKDNGNAIKDSGEEFFMTEDNPEGTFHWINTNMPVTFSCEDQYPHPVERETLCFKVSYDYPEWGYITDEYCDGELNHDGYCCEAVDEDSYEFYFAEDSMHNLEYYCEDGLGTKTDEHVQYYKVDSTAPSVEKIMNGPYEGTCPPVNDEDICYVDTATSITLDIVDGGDICHVDNVECRWRYNVNDGEFSEWFTYSDEEPIIFPEESNHELHIQCWDALGNTWEDREFFQVDKTSPAIAKEYSGPHQVYEFEDYWAEWANLSTAVNAGVTDDGPHKSGIDTVEYRVSVVDNAYCEQYYKGDETECDNAEGSGEWTSVNSENWGEFSFGFNEESCHLIEIYAEDNVGKNTTHKQCVFVDNTAPTPIKTVNEPKDLWDGLDSVYYPWIGDYCWNGQEDSIDCWKVTLLTPITMDCEDQDPHPVDHEKVYFNVDFDGEDITELYCEEYYQGTYVYNEEHGKWFCKMDDVVDNFYFREESEHNLMYYCEDALGNTGPLDDEKFKVEGTTFEIELNKKWNLVSVPFVLINDDPEDVLESVEENVESVWTYDSYNDEWFVYRPASPETSNLEDIIPGWGYWLRAYNPDTLVLGGSLFSPQTTPPSRNLKTGWNIIGYYGLEGVDKYPDDPGFIYPNPPGNGKTAYCALFSLLEGYMDIPFSALVSYWEPWNPHQWIDFAAFDRLDPGAGYWVQIPTDGIYSYTTYCDV